jgi:hypothetical protein
MKSWARSFILVGLAMNTGRASAQPVKGFDRLDASLESVTGFRNAVGPQRAPIGFARAAAVDTRDVRTIQGYSVSRNQTASSGVGEISPGILGGGIGAAVGGAVAFLWVQAHREQGIDGPTARPVLTGAAIGVILGLFVEWVVRSGPTPAPPR